jgi:hypothetical protein
MPSTCAAKQFLSQIVSGEYRSCTDLLKLAEAVVDAQMAKDRDASLKAWGDLMKALRGGREQERGWEQFRPPRLAAQAQAARSRSQTKSSPAGDVPAQSRDRAFAGRRRFNQAQREGQG